MGSFPTVLPTRTPGTDPHGIGGAKTDLAPWPPAERGSRLPQDEVNRWLDAIVALCVLMGEDGSVDPAALRVRIAALEAPAAAARVTVQSGAAYTWNVSTYKRVSVTHAAAKFALTLSSTGWTAGEERQLDIDNAGGFGVQIILATGTDVLNNQAAGVGYTTLPGSTVIPSGSLLPASFQITYMGAGVWKIR